MKKKTLDLFAAIILTASLSLCFAGCGKDHSREAEEAQLDAVSSSLGGVLTQYTGSVLSLKTEDGETLTFENCSHANLELKNGIVPGNEVLLIYVGSIKETDTSNVKIRKIIVEQDNAGLVSAKDKEIISGSAASGATYSATGQEYPKSGVKVEKTNGTGTIIGGVNVRADAKSGAELLGQLQDGDTVTVTGICENGWYRIVYEDGTAFIWKDYIVYEP